MFRVYLCSTLVERVGAFVPTSEARIRVSSSSVFCEAVEVAFSSIDTTLTDLSRLFQVPLARSLAALQATARSITVIPNDVLGMRLIYCTLKVLCGHFFEANAVQYRHW